MVIVLDGVSDVSKTTLFVFAALSLIPLAWLIGEATEHLAVHTGPGVGGFLNATFGNAPELIIALIAVNNGLGVVVRGSLVGSVVGNTLLVLGFSLTFGRGGEVDRVSAFTSLGLVALATALFFVPASAGWLGHHGHKTIITTTVPAAIALLALYIAVTWRSLRRHHRQHVSDLPASVHAWPLPFSLATLAAATVVTAFVAEIVVHTIDAFATEAHLSDFFVAAVIVAIAGNAAEHGGAVVVAARGHLDLAAEIALSSASQVAVFLIPAIALVSWLVNPLALSFRPVELIALMASVAIVTALFASRRFGRRHGVALIVTYFAVALAFFLAGRS